MAQRFVYIPLKRVQASEKKVLRDNRTRMKKALAMLLAFCAIPTSLNKITIRAPVLRIALPLDIKGNARGSSQGYLLGARSSTGFIPNNYRNSGLEWNGLTITRAYGSLMIIFLSGLFGCNVLFSRVHMVPLCQDCRWCESRK